MPAPPFLAQKPFEASHPDAFAIYCSDGRFTDAVEELLHGLGHARLDTLTLPGGPALFNPWLAGMSPSLTVGEAAKFLIESHAIKRAILIAHEGCGFYATHYRGVKASEIKKHQEDDLRRAREALKPTGVAVFLYVAVVADARVRFEAIL
jgi:nitrogen regulatory protein PII-like uncharacterized protein